MSNIQELKRAGAKCRNALELFGGKKDIGSPKELHLQESLYETAGDDTGYLRPQCGTEPFSGELLRRKTKSWIAILQLTGTVSQQWNYRSYQARLVH